MKSKIRNRISDLREEAEKMERGKEKHVRRSPAYRSSVAALNRIEEQIEFLESLLD